MFETRGWSVNWSICRMVCVSALRLTIDQLVSLSGQQWRVFLSIHFDSLSFSVEIQKNPNLAYFWIFPALTKLWQSVLQGATSSSWHQLCVWRSCEYIYTISWTSSIITFMATTSCTLSLDPRAVPLLSSVDPPSGLKNVFICFPGGSHRGLYLFNKVSPRELQRECALLVLRVRVLNESIIFSFMYYSTTGPLRALIPLPPTPNPHYKTTRRSAQPGILTYLIHDTLTSCFTSYCFSDNCSS